MTDEQKNECASIIKTASRAALAAGAVSEIAVKAVQVTMIINLAGIFDVPVTKAIASGMVNSFFSGSFVWEAARWIFPASRVLTAIHAADKTEDFGWRVAKDFDEYRASEVPING